MPVGTTHGRRDGCRQHTQPRTPITIIGSNATPSDGTRTTRTAGGPVATAAAAVAGTPTERGDR
ncbi:hypothetical protein Hbl1158_04430 [Halobaculum sp. CBA1158]|uniref:hypothetical protein n=1 Tax=Halobaculum sp. CBA1158 TaxID=2904243 RepID=UPI001F201E59|nr:hypothetical protein [Halobaculum sp. CBA1158]UIP00614.1 hypothetical protein Hbl1158_04430 [Halobaculum sp. CBA1158]